MMNSKQYCRYCLEVEQITEVRSWEIGSHQLKILGCSSCQERHEEEVTALKAEMTSLRAAFAKSTECHESELPRVAAESSLALMNKTAEYEQLLSEVNILKAVNNRQRSKVHFLKLQPLYECQLRAATASSRSSRIAAGLVRRSSRIAAGLVRNSSSRIAAELAGKSSVFREMISASDTPEQAFQHLLKTVPLPVLCQILIFCRLGEMTFSKIVRADEVFEVAHNLEIGFLKKFCESELCRLLSVDNAPQMLQLSRKFAATKLREGAEKLLKEHFDMVKTKIYDGLEGFDDGTSRRI